MAKALILGKFFADFLFLGGPPSFGEDFEPPRKS